MFFFFLMYNLRLWPYSLIVELLFSAIPLLLKEGCP